MNFNCVCVCAQMCRVLCVCLPCDIVKRLSVVIHEASTEIGASILFPRETRARERERETETAAKKRKERSSCEESCNKDARVEGIVHTVVFHQFVPSCFSQLVSFTLTHTGKEIQRLDRVRDFNYATT